MSCLASFVCLPSDLTPYSGCAELRIGDVLMIRVIRQKNGTLHALHTLLTRKGSGDAVSPDQRDTVSGRGRGTRLVLGVLLAHDRCCENCSGCGGDQGAHLTTHTGAREVHAYPI